MTHIAVLGAGITGVTTAFNLLERGFEVTIFDRNRYAAMETSFANGGQLSASNAEVWNTFATVLKGMKWMLQKQAPLLINPRPGWHKASWMAEFLGNIPNYKRNTIATTRMAIAARPMLIEMAERAGIDFDLEKRGILHFYRDEKTLAQGRKVSKLLAEGGLERIELSGAEVIDREPTLHGTFAGGFWTESDMTGDIHKFTIALAKWLGQQGVTLKLGVPVETLSTQTDGVRVNGTKFDGVVVAAGVASRWMAHELGDRVNVYPVKGYSVTIPLEDDISQNAAPWVSLLDEKSKIVTSRLGLKRFRIAGTAEFNGDNRDIRADRIKPLVEWVEKLFPDVCTEQSVPWAGLRPMMPGMMPRVGRGHHARVFYNTGHGHLGWTLSGATAAAVSDVVAQALRPSASAASTGVTPELAA
ncbi:MAG: D-amino-acid dehydrogenase [Paracoccaceae bacterium]|jgi:D-amino-acid dehydrogenase